MIRKTFPNNIELPNGRTLNHYVAPNTGKSYNWIHAYNTKISHEVPLSMLEMSRSFNDYDYALVHLLKDYPEYFGFYKRSLEMGRMVILDNSLYELGEAFDMSDYAIWIDKLQPTYYIIPDTFWDSQATINQAMEWLTGWGSHLNPKIKKIGVAQGATYEEIKQSYKFMDSIGCDCIAFTFKFSPEILKSEKLKLSDLFDHSMIMNDRYELMGDDLLDEDKQAIIRYVILNQLEDDGIINKDKEHHLLGLQNTTALCACCSFPWITSIDTSNPIINGIDGNLYYFNNEWLCCDYTCECKNIYIGNSGRPKPTTTLKDVFTGKITQETLNNIMHNVRSFRDIVNPPCMSTILLNEGRVENYIPENVKKYLE